MAEKICKVFILTSILFQSTSQAGSSKPDLTQSRIGKSLLGTFPFKTDNANHHRHHEHQPLNVADGILRQVEALPPTIITTTSSPVIEENKRCVEKVMMVEEVEFENSIECHHSYDKQCHTTYTTDYVPEQKEECSENFKKNCYIEYKPTAFNETVEICNEKLIRNCDEPGPTVCETVYESECETSYHEHEIEEDVPECQTMQIEKCHDVTEGYTTKKKCDKWPKQVCNLVKKTVKRYSPETQCHQIPRDVCGPGPCPIVPGPKQCRHEIKTVVQEIPDETCSLNPQRVCKSVTILVPRLIPRENCVEVPKEICSRLRRNPRKVKRPVIKKWCYTPQKVEEESEEETTEDEVEEVTINNIIKEETDVEEEKEKEMEKEQEDTPNQY